MAASGVSVDERTLKTVYSKLVDGLKATDIIDNLFEKDLLILDEYQSIFEACSQSSTSEDSRYVNRLVLTAILRRPPGFVAQLVTILRKKDRSLANALEKGERHYKRFVCMLCDAYEGVDLVAQLVMLCGAYERLNLSGVADPSPPAEGTGTAAYIGYIVALECNYCSWNALITRCYHC